MPQQRSPDRLQERNDSPREQTDRRIAQINQLMKKLEPCALEPQDEIEELDSNVWDLDTVLSIGSLYFITSNDLTKMQVVKIDENGNFSPNQAVHPLLAAAAAKKIVAMRQNSTPEIGAPSRPQREEPVPPSRERTESFSRYQFTEVDGGEAGRMLMSPDERYVFGFDGNKVTGYRVNDQGEYEEYADGKDLVNSDYKRSLLAQGRVIGWRIDERVLGLDVPSSPSRPSPDPAPSAPSRPDRPAPTPAPSRPEAPAPAPSRVPAPPERIAERDSEESANRVYDYLRGMQAEIGGVRLPIAFDPSIDSPKQLASFLRKRAIPVARYESYARTMVDHMNIVARSFGRERPEGWVVTFKGNHFELQNGAKTLFTTATGVLKKIDASTAETQDGHSVSIIPRATSTEYVIGGTREIHRSDGSIQCRLQGDKQEYFDGSNDTPIMERDSTHSYVYGTGGKMDVLEKITRSQAEAHADKIVRTLRTPEAIGAFVSQFYLAQEYKKIPSDNSAWLGQIQKTDINPVRFVLEPHNVQDVQHWKRTLETRSGDCEDYALLAKALLEKLGIKSLAMRVSPGHFQAIYFERAGIEDGKQAYFTCSVGLYGFARSKETFTDLGDAAKSAWEGSGSAITGMIPEIRDDMSEDQKQLIRDAKEHGGIEYFEQPENEDDGRGTFSHILPYKGEAAEDLKSYVRG